MLVEDIEGGYFDKLRAAPVSRSAIVLGRLVAEAFKGVLIACLIIVLSRVFGIDIASGPLGFVLLVALTALWSANPVTYVMEALRSLILQDLRWGKIALGFGVVAVLGVVMILANVRTIEHYD